MFHLLDRFVMRLTLFDEPDDYAYVALMRVAEETWQKNPLPIFAMSVMPNHWHFDVRPMTDTQLTELFQKLTVTNIMSWLVRYATGGKPRLNKESQSLADGQQVLKVHLSWSGDIG